MTVVEELGAVSSDPSPLEVSLFYGLGGGIDCARSQCTDVVVRY